MVCKNGVIIVSDRRQKDKLIVEASANKISEIDEHLMAVASGIVSDSRVLIDKARVLAQQHRVTYDSEVTTEAIVKEIADVQQQFTQYGGARPFGVALMIAGFNGSAKLYTTDVTGNYLEYKANAIGESDESIREKLRKEYTEGLTTEQGIKLALKIFEEVQGEKFDKNRFDIGVIGTDKKIQRKRGYDY
jgi:proteasome alpha subunit